MICLWSILEFQASRGYIGSLFSLLVSVDSIVNLEYFELSSPVLLEECGLCEFLNMVL